MSNDLPFNSNLRLKTDDFEEAENFISSRIDKREVKPLTANHDGSNLFTLQPLCQTQMFGAHWSERVHIQSDQLSTGHIVFPLDKSIYVNSLGVELKPKDLLLLTPGESADLVWESGCSSIVVTFDYAALQAQFAVSKEELVSGSSRIFHAQDTVTRSLFTLFRSIDSYHEIFEGELEDKLQKQWQAMLFDSCEDLLIERGLAKKDILPAHIKRAIDWVMNNIDKNIAINEVANVANCSRRSLEQGFNQFVGVSPARFIIKTRLESAHEKLLQGQGSVGDVAFECGFNHLSYFTTLYKDLYGETPSQTLKRRSVISIR